MVILASTSRHRQGLLQRAGIPFVVVTPTVDEESLKDGRPPHELAMFLAETKGASVARVRPDDIVIGCDQICLHRGEIFEKPGTRENALRQLLRLQGETHDLLTAMAVFHQGTVHRRLEVPRLTMRSLTRKQLERYVDADGPLDCSGSYRLESRGICLFERIETSDHSAVVGLPVMALVSLLATMGVELP